MSDDWLASWLPRFKPG